MKYKTALITGASSGIGYSFAKTLASIGSDLVLISRNEEKLKGIKNEFETKYKNKIWILSCNLAFEGSTEKITAFLDENNINIDLLINNAGIGLYGGFDKTEGIRENEIIQTNITALTQLTKAITWRMIEKNAGTILNVSSTFAFHKSPNWSVYAASKAFIFSFTRSLSIGFRKTPLKFAVLCPGRTATRFAQYADATDKNNKKSENPDYVADYAIRKLMHGKMLIIPGLKNKAKYILFKYIPEFMTDFLVK